MARFTALLGLLLVAALSACGGARVPQALTNGQVSPSNNAALDDVTRAGSPLDFKTLYSFGGPPDASFPYAGLINVGGTFYGTSIKGGAHGHGSVFSITPAGTETIIYSFKGFKAGDGDWPMGELVDVGGTLYGTTMQGGAGCALGCGTVFSVTPAGDEKIVYAFSGFNDDGRTPNGSLLDVNGTLYGTTSGGGKHSDGTVFSVTPAGAETVIYDFLDGKSPESGLIDVNGTFYGTTAYGGPTNDGTVFSVTPAGVGKIIYAFRGGADGQLPYDGLVNVNGTLYGTTFEGGTAASGTVFSVNLAGKEKVIHSFGVSSGDGIKPYGGLVYLTAKGTFYGTTSEDGALGASGRGVVFSVTPAGSESVVYSFKAGSDSTAQLLNVNGTLYGTTFYGGAHNKGTVFRTDSPGP